VNAIDLLKRHEGFKAKVYLCPAGKQSIGYGYNLEANPLRLPPDVIEDLYKNGITWAKADKLLVGEVNRLELILIEKLPWFGLLNEARKAVLLNMAYNLGINGLLKFKRTLGHIQEGDYHLAAREMLESNWARQVHGRASELSLIMRTGAMR
jgi:lysozyme